MDFVYLFFRLRTKLKHLADQYMLSEQQHEQRVQFIFFLQTIYEASFNCDLFIYLIFFLKWTAETEITGATDFWIKNQTAWGETHPWTVSDEGLCRSSFSAFSNGEKLAGAANIWWREVPAVPGLLSSPLIFLQSIHLLFFHKIICS